MRQTPTFRSMLLVVLPVLSVAAQVSPEATSQDTKAAKEAEAQTEAPAKRMPRVLRYPEHRGVVLARLDGKDIRLMDLGEHLKTRFDPGILERWAMPQGVRELNSPDLGQLLYQYLDMLALKAEATDRKLPLSELQGAVDDLLKEDFEKNYKEKYRQVMKKEIAAASLDFHRAQHRRKTGLRLEIQALLNGLVPKKYKESELRAFHAKNGRYFGGKVKLAHILFETRDRATGRLLSADKLAAVRKRIRDVREQLAKKPEDFQKIAAKNSDDRVTASKGGLIGWVTRFDKRLPAALVRAVWSIDSGAISDPVESYYGYHIACRVKFVQNHFILPMGKTYQKIAGSLILIRQEDYLFACRKRHARKLYL